jgi:acyl-CoA hydrolase
VGELVMKASVNYVGNSSMIVGIRVESENIQTGAKKHYNSSYFTMVSKIIMVKNAKVQGLILCKIEEVALYKYLKQISLKKKRPPRGKFRLQFKGSMGNLEKYRVSIEIP